MSIEPALHAALAHCRPDKAHLDLLNTQADLWADRLGVRLPAKVGLLRPMPFGSTSRSTATAPINDCDRILFLDLPFDSTGQPKISPCWLLDELTRVATEALAALKRDGHDVPYLTRPQGHSVGLRHERGWAHVDIVPMVPAPGSSLPHRPERAHLPERATDRWIEVRPFEQRSRLLDLAERVRALPDAIVLLKAWKRQRSLPLPSIAIEQLLMALCRRASSLESLVLGGLDSLKRLRAGLSLPGVPASILDALAPEEGAEIGEAARETLRALRPLAAAIRGDLDEGAAEQGVSQALLGDLPSPTPEALPPLWVESDLWKED